MFPGFAQRVFYFSFFIRVFRVFFLDLFKANGCFGGHKLCFLVSLNVFFIFHFL